MTKAIRTKVVHLSSVHYAFDNRIFFKECTSLAHAGYAVTLIAPDSHGDVICNDVTVRALSMPKNRLERITSTVIKVFLEALKCHAAIYHFHDPELIPIGWLLKLCGKRVIYDVHEDYSGTMADKRWIPFGFRGLASLGVRLAETLAAGQFDYVLTATPKIAMKFAPRRTRAIQNFPRSSELISPTGLNHRDREPIVAYVGALSNIRGLREMAFALTIARRVRPLRLITAGKVTLGADAAIDGQGVDGTIEHLGMQSREQVRDLLSRSRVGIVTLHPTKNYVDSQPTKLYEYMSAGLPVVASDFPVWRKVIDSADCGLLVDPLDPDAIARALLWLIENPEEAEAMGRRGQVAIAEKYNWEREARKLVELYSSLAAT